MRYCCDHYHQHWRIENNLHWNLDVIFREESCQARKDNSPVNLNLMRKMILELLHQAQPKGISKRRMVVRARLNPDYLYELLEQLACNMNGE